MRRWSSQISFWLLWLYASAATPAKAGAFIDGATLFEKCSRKDAQILLCSWYMNGVVDTMLLYQERFGVRALCLPEGTISDTVDAVAMTYLLKHPDELKYEAASTVAKALIAAFPCRR